MEITQANRSGGDRLPPADEPTPLERSWSAAAVLLAWLGTFTGVSITGKDSSAGGVIGWDLVGPAVVFAAAAALIGLAVFLPARPSAAGIRVGAYAGLVLLGTVLILLTEPGIYVGLAIAFLPAWALLTALYGSRGGLPAGRRYVIMYAAAALVAVGAGYVAARLILLLGFAGPPAGVFGLLLPLLPLLLLLQTRYRRSRRRTIVEIALSTLVAACGTAWFGLLGYGPGWSPDLGAAAALTAWIVAVTPTAVLLGLGYLGRFDTAEYQSRAERVRAQRAGAERLGSAGPHQS